MFPFKKRCMLQWPKSSLKSKYLISKKCLKCVCAEERCMYQQEQCTEKFEPLPSGAGSVCASILQYLNCLQLLRDTCMHDAGYQGRVGSVRDMFLSESCNRNPRSPVRGAAVPGRAIPGPAVPGSLIMAWRKAPPSPSPPPPQIAVHK